MPKFVADLSDDEVILVPFVKPTPPMIVLSESEGEGEDKSTSPSENSSKAKESDSRLPSIGSLRRERDGPRLTGEKGKRKGTARRQKSKGDNSKGKNGGDTCGERSHNVDPPRSCNATSSTSKDSSIENETILHTGNIPVINHISSNIFDPSETAMMDCSNKNSTPPNGLVDQSPQSSSNSGKKPRRRQSTIVKEQFQNFLQGLNLPVPPGRKRQGLPGNATSEVTPTSVVPGSSTVDVTGENQGIVTVAQETSASSNVKRKKVRKAASAPASSVASPVKSGRDTPVVDLQYNLTTSPLNLLKEGKTKPTKKSTKKLKELQESQQKVPRKRKQEKGDEDTVLKSRKTERRSKSDETGKKKVPKAKVGKQVRHSLSTTHSSAFPKHWNSEMQKFYGTIDTVEFNLQEILSKQPVNPKRWQASDDKHQNQRRKSRTACDFCGKFDHISPRCSLRGIPTRCIYCGDKDHKKESCKLGQICLLCGAEQRKVQKACDKCLFRKPKPISCSLCGTAGHFVESCPDNWRRYHSTTIDIDHAEKQLVEMIDKLANRKSHLNTIQHGLVQNKGKEIFVKAYKKVTDDVEKLEEDIKEVREKIEEGNRSKLIESVGFKYTPRFKQYCCNCSLKGHNHTMCKVTRGKGSLLPNKTYVIKELDSKVSSVSNARETSGTGSLNQKQLTENPKDVLNSVEEGTFTIDLTDSPPSSPPPETENLDKETIVEGSNEMTQSQAPPLLTRPSGHQSEYFEDDMSSSFDVHQGFVPVQQGLHPLVRSSIIPSQPMRMHLPCTPPMAMPYPPFNFPPPPMWRDGTGRIQYHPNSPSHQTEIVHIPVPIPVPAEDYERLTRQGYPHQFQFPHLFPPMGNLFQQILPTRFPPPQRPNIVFSMGSQGPTNTTVTSKPQVQSDTQGCVPKTVVEDYHPPSPDSTENLIPISTRLAEASPEIKFLEKVQKEKLNEKSIEPIKITLLPSEWELFDKNKAKSKLINTIGGTLGLRIEICRETMTIGITGGDLKSMAIGKRNIVELLQAEAAGIEFKLNFKPQAEDSPEQEVESPSLLNQSQHKDNKRQSQQRSSKDNPSPTVSKNYQRGISQYRPHHNYRDNGNRYRGSADRSYEDRVRYNRRVYFNNTEMRNYERFVDHTLNGHSRENRRGQNDYTNPYRNNDRGYRTSYYNRREYNSSEEQPERNINYERPRRYFEAPK